MVIQPGYFDAEPNAVRDLVLRHDYCAGSGNHLELPL